MNPTTNSDGKIIAAHLCPAYNRRPVTATALLYLFYRGMDFQFGTQNVGPYTSIRDCAPGATIQFRYGKQLHKILLHTVTTQTK